MQIAKYSGSVGAQISSVDLNTLTDVQFDDIRTALFDHGVVFFRDQAITPNGHIALAERFADIDVNRFFNPVPDFPMIAEVETKPDQKAVIGGTWHTDHSYDPEPAMASILVAKDLPPYGGDTLFASCNAAFHALSDGMKDTLMGLNAWHSDASFAGSEILYGIGEDAMRDASLHPVVIAHPVTGQPSIYVNGDFTTHIDGWTRAESAPLLQYLYDWIARPEFSCRFRWQPGSVAIWENRLVHHFACADYTGHRRYMHRITVKGCALAPYRGDYSISSSR